MVPKILLGLVLAAAVQAATADVLLLDSLESSLQAVPSRPARGMSMERVEATFGAPSLRAPPVGGDAPQHPPITRWEYPNFVVYFEHRAVVHSVARR